MSVLVQLLLILVKCLTFVGIERPSPLKTKRQHCSVWQKSVWTRISLQSFVQSTKTSSSLVRAFIVKFQTHTFTTSRGLKTEYQSNYPKPACSDFYPYLQENGVYFPESLSKASPWQDLCPPAMYSTESCHIGSVQHVRAVVDVNSPLLTKVVKHKSPCCCKI